MDKTAAILVAGADTLAGSALVEELREQGYSRVLTESEGPADLSSEADVKRLFDKVHPEYVFLTGGLAGGIGLNKEKPATLMLNNLHVEVNVIESARRCGVRKLLYLASSCCYPRNCPQPMKPGYLMTGPLEPTNEAYAAAKTAGIQLCQAYRQQYGANFVAAIPSTPFGPGDCFDDARSHVVSALMRRTHEATIAGAGNVTIWGSGEPVRDFIYSRDLAVACIFAMERYDGTAPLNLGVNEGVTIRDLAQLTGSVTGFKGRFVFDSSKPDGMPRKMLDASELYAMGWRPAFSLRRGLEQMFKWYVQSLGSQ